MGTGEWGLACERVPRATGLVARGRRLGEEVIDSIGLTTPERKVVLWRHGRGNERPRNRVLTDH